MATRSLSGIKLNLKLTASVVNTLTDNSSVSANQPLFTYAPTIADGIDANQANRGWHSQSRTLASGAQEILDLHSLPDIGAGSGNDALGQALLFEELVALVIVNENAVGVAGQLEIMPSNSEGFDPVGSHTVANGGALYGQGVLMKIQLAANGFDVQDQKHRITFRAIGGSVSYSVYLMGRHDDEESSSSSSSLSSLSSSSLSSVSSLSSSSPSASSLSSISTSSSSISTSSISTSSSSISTSSSSESVSSSSSSSLSSSSSSSLSSNSSQSTSSSSQSPSESSSSLSSS
jgi:hypothetical protein